MKIAFFSNYLNHHQLPLCQEFCKLDDVDFTFVSTERLPQYRVDMRYEDMNLAYPFVLRAYESPEEEDRAKELAINADIVIIGSAPNFYIEERLNQYNKLTYRFCERSLKKGTWRRFIPKVYNRIKNEYLQYKNKNFYILGSSAYTASDLVICGFPKEKCYRWGYFPLVQKFEHPEEVLNYKIPRSLVWVGRMVRWKHPEISLRIANSLHQRGIDFTLKMVGDGPLRKRLEKYVQDHDLQGEVIFCGMQSPMEVRKIMAESEIFLFNSDFYEGWGAVLNEAMNSLCVPIVSHSCGSAAFLIEQGENGFIYEYGKGHTEATQRVQWLFENDRIRRQMGCQAYETIASTWNAKKAARRLLSISISSGEYQTGPASYAPVLRNTWYKRRKR